MGSRYARQPPEPGKSMWLAGNTEAVAAVAAVADKADTEGNRSAEAEAEAVEAEAAAVAAEVAAVEPRHTLQARIA